MVILQRLATRRNIWLAGWLATVGLMLPGCGAMGSDEFESLINDLAGSTKTLTTTTAIRIVNQSSAVLTIKVLVDGEMETYTCSSQRICEYPLALCPDVIQLISERRFDTSGTFLGGRDFADAALFQLTHDDFQCNETIIFRFTESDVDLLIL